MGGGGPGPGFEDEDGGAGVGREAVGEDGAGGAALLEMVSESFFFWRDE